MYYYPNSYATTTIDFQNPNPDNIKQVLKESWPLFGLVGIAGIFLGVTNIIGNPTLHYITAGLSLVAAGYGYFSSRPVT